MKLNTPQMILKFVIDFAKKYHEHQINTRIFKYRIASDFDYYHKYKKLILCFTDRPGDTLSAMTVSEIKSMKDIILNMHPIDVNTINDLHYLHNDEIDNLIIMGDRIVAKNYQGDETEYKLDSEIELSQIKSTRLAYTIGYAKAERVVRSFYNSENRYKIINDNISSLNVLDVETGEQHLVSALDLLFSDNYKFYSKEDIAKIGFICGQIANNKEIK